VSRLPRWLRASPFDYYFGIYHWRERGRRLLRGLVLLAGAAVLALARGGSRCQHRGRRFLALGLAVWGVTTGWDPAQRLLSPPPWHVDTVKYERLAERLPLAGADRVVDVGCGTGRSLVGLAAGVDDAQVVGLDVFDDRVILGNAPALARRNAAAAGLDCAVVRGDAATLPFEAGSVDVLTTCRVLHDLPRPAAEDALAEAYRVCSPGGAVGVLELPLPHDADADPTLYWRALVADAGFSVEHVETFERAGRAYTVVVGVAD
jgi:ubiquinone/menaquinone biosynthesis C-methylase UbiE